MIMIKFLWKEFLAMKKFSDAIWCAVFAVIFILLYFFVPALHTQNMLYGFLYYLEQQLHIYQLHLKKKNKLELRIVFNSSFFMCYNIYRGGFFMSSYDFLSLLVTTIILHGNSPIIEKSKLQQKLYSYYQNPDYDFLFKDITILDESVDLSNAFSLAYNSNLLIKTYDEEKAIINLSYIEAKEKILNYDLEIARIMADLVTLMYQVKDEVRILVI